MLEFKVAVTNRLAKAVYDVGFDVTAAPETTIDFDRLSVVPAFAPDSLGGLSPIIVGGVYASGEPMSLFKFQRIDAETSYPFVVTYDAREGEENTPAIARELSFRVTSIADQPSPIVSLLG